MADTELKKYTFEVNGLETTLQLNDKDAKARGLDPSKDGKPLGKTAAAQKARTAANKASTAAANKATTSTGQ